MNTKFWELETSVTDPRDGFTSTRSAKFTHKQSALKLARTLTTEFPGTEYRLWHWERATGSRYQMVWKLIQTNGQSTFPVKYRPEVTA